MALTIDTTHALRTYEEKVALVAAIRDASKSEQELDWVEWKSDWDLTDTRYKYETARHVLGFGNRTVDAAHGICEGCAYLVAGVEPQNLCGTLLVDSGDLTQGLRQYVKSGAPRWSPDYVELDGKTVLVITVERPKQGDRICTLQKGYNQIKKGAIFVRRHGQTETADPDEIMLLEDRFSSVAEEQLALEVVRADEPSRQLKLVVMDEAAEAAWIREEEDRLLGSLPAPRRRRDTFDALTSIHDFSPPEIPSFLSGDSRSQDAIRDEVSDYIEAAGRRWRLLNYEKAVERNDNAILLELRNTSRHNYESVRIVLTAPPSLVTCATLEEIAEGLGAPEPPELFGELRYSPVILPDSVLNSLAHSDSSRPSVYADFDAMPPTAVFSVPEVRSGDYIKLPAVYLLGGSDEDLGETRELSWKLTTRSHDGDATGIIRYEISPNPIDHSTAVAMDRYAEDE